MKTVRKLNIPIFLIFIPIAIVILFPLVWIFFSSFKMESQIMGDPSSFLPKVFSLESYVVLFKQIPFMRMLSNSVIFSFGVTILSLFFDAMAGYAFAKLPFKGSSILFMIILVSMMIPFQITMIPLYLIVNKMGLLNSFAGLIVPRLSNAFGIYFMRQSFKSFPKELIEAGRIDGLNEFNIFLRIGIPTLKSSFLTLGIFHFMYNWNDFLWPMIIATSKDMYTMSVGLALFQGEHVMAHGPMFAGALLSLLPILIFYMMAQKTFISGIAVSGIKE